MDSLYKPENKHQSNKFNFSREPARKKVVSQPKKLWWQFFGLQVVLLTSITFQREYFVIRWNRCTDDLYKKQQHSVKKDIIFPQKKSKVAQVLSHYLKFRLKISPSSTSNSGSSTQWLFTDFKLEKITRCEEI